MAGKPRRRAGSVASLIFATSPHTSPVTSTTHLPTIPSMAAHGSIPSSPTAAFGLPPVPLQQTREGGPKPKRSLKALFRRFTARDEEEEEDGTDDELDFGCSGYHTDEEMDEGGQAVHSRGVLASNAGLGIEGFVQSALTPGQPPNLGSHSQSPSSTNVSVSRLVPHSRRDMRHSQPPDRSPRTLDCSRLGQEFASTSPSTAASESSTLFSGSSSARSSASYSSCTTSSAMCSPSISQSLCLSSSSSSSSSTSFLPATPANQEYYFPHRRISTAHQREDTVTLSTALHAHPVAESAACSPPGCEDEERAAIEALEAYFASQRQARAASASAGGSSSASFRFDEFGRRASSPDSSPLTRKTSRPEIRTAASAFGDQQSSSRPAYPSLRTRRSENCLYSAARGGGGSVRSKQYDGSLSLQRRPAFTRERSYTTTNVSPWSSSSSSPSAQQPILTTKGSFSIPSLQARPLPTVPSSPENEPLPATLNDDTLPPLPTQTPASSSSVKYFSGTSIVSPPTSRRGSLASGNLQRPQYTYV